MLTDWGARDPSPAICRGVVLGIAPEALIVDISHEIDKYNIRHGALMLWCALPFLPIGAHMAVVDPGRGHAAPRRRHRDRPAATSWSARTTACCSPARNAWAASPAPTSSRTPQYRLPVLSSTFHGRDLFARPRPTWRWACRSSRSARRSTRTSWSRSTGPRRRALGELESTVIYLDTFGNVKLPAHRRPGRGAPGLEHGEDCWRSPGQRPRRGRCPGRRPLATSHRASRCSTRTRTAGCASP